MIEFTVVTVCLNTEAVIDSTIASVLNQTYTSYEYIIKDGLSKDGTLNIAESYLEKFEKKNVPFRIYSQKDNGIYQAMNQAILEARGRWIIFMNAGDRFANEHVLEQVEDSGFLDTADVIYGDMIFQERDLYQYRKAKDMQMMRFGLPFSHQSTFTKKSLFEEKPYSEKYRLNSDHQFYYERYMEGKKFCYIPEPLSIFLGGGSCSNWKLHCTEKLQMLENMAIRDEEAIQRVKQAIKVNQRNEWINRYIRRLIPKKLEERMRDRMYRRAGWKTEEEMFGSMKGTI